MVSSNLICGLSMQVPAALGLQHNHARTMQSLAGALNGAVKHTPLIGVAKSAFSQAVALGMSTGGLHGHFASLRR
jgi:Na+/alanine symporter